MDADGLVAIGRNAHQLVRLDVPQSFLHSVHVEGCVIAGGHKDHIRAIVSEFRAHLTRYIIVDGHKP